MAVYKDKVMILKWKGNKDLCLVSTTHDEKLVPTRIGGQNIKRVNAVVNCKSVKGGVDISDDCRNTRKRLKNYNQKHFLYFTDTYSFNSYLLYKRKLEFQYSLLRNSISEVSQN